MHPRRRKKRIAGAGSGEGTRTVALRRGDGGFGFTISGQQPCILSCIVPGSNADLAGLRAGNFLISVNGVNVSRSPHDTVVQLIGGAPGGIDVTLAESYYSDSSEEGSASGRVPAGARVRPRHVHKAKNRPLRGQSAARATRWCEELYQWRGGGRCGEGAARRPADPLANLRATADPQRPSYAHLVPHEPACGLAATGAACEPPPQLARQAPVECRALLAYLGTIEMPRQIATGCKLQTVRSCVRKLRQEKRSSAAVLMTVQPAAMTLRSAGGALLAEYAARRINYVSCMSDSDYRYFGLVTSATHVDTNEEIFPREEDAVTVEISHSCHVFTVEPRLVEHAVHVRRAAEFRVVCTRDPVTGRCLEFPASADYIVNIIRLMYSLNFTNGFSGKLESISKLSVKSGSPAGGVNFSRNRPPLVRGPRYDRGPRRHTRRRCENGPQVENNPANGHFLGANSPQPSNHSEITTTSSNSDSGIGFHNDCQNVSDRIVVVDFANPPQNFNANVQHGNHYEPRIGVGREAKQRPLGISGAGNFDMDSSFLSNTTPVVEGFGGLGQPLNHDNEILPNMGESSSSIFNANVMNISNRSKSKDNSTIHDRCLPCHSRHVEPSCSDQDKLNVRALLGSSSYTSDPLINIKCHYADDSSASYSSITQYQNVSEDFTHYDPVYTEPEDHHYEMIKPNTKDNASYEQIDENFSEMVLYNDCYPTDKVDIVTESHKSNDTESVDNMTVISTKSCDYMHNRQSSVDNVSMYSCRSHENTSKVKHSLKPQSSVDDILMFGLNENRPLDDHTFLRPSRVKSKFRKPLNLLNKTKQILNLNDKNHDKKGTKDVLEEYKLSPSVYGARERRACASEDEVSGLVVRGECSNSESEEWTWSVAPVESTRSEPDLRSPEQARSTEPHDESEQSSPFRRWASGGGGGSLGPRSYRRPGSLVASSDHDMFSKCGGGGERAAEGAEGAARGAGAVTRWSLGLDQLLADPAGAAAFAAFLRKEFSAENIRFWLACERFRTSADADRAQVAHDIWSRHLAEGAPEPVNVDAHARAAAQRALQHAPPDLFAQAQKQIFTLMKFDSYPRFLLSEIHSECARAELCGLPSPYLQQQSPTPTKLKKSVSNAEERRRGSLLPPWVRLRGSSKDRPPPAASAPATPGDSGRRPSFSGVMRPGVQLCKVLLPDSATSVVPVDGGSVRQLVDRLLEKRAIRCDAYDVLVVGDSRPLDAAAAASTLAGREVAVERRVSFRLEFAPLGKAMTVRTRPDKPLSAVLRPALQRQTQAGAVVRVTRAGETLPLDTLVKDLDGARLQVHLSPVPIVDKPLRPKAVDPTDLQLTNQPPPSALPNRQAVPAIRQAQGASPTNQQPKTSYHTLDEITNRVFEEVLQGKAELQIPLTDNSMKSECGGSEHSSAGGRSVVAKLRAGTPLLTATELAEHQQSAQQRLRPPAPPVPAARSLTKPCPAARPSLTRAATAAATSTSTAAAEPPPLPPKPKVQPVRPSNWGSGLPDASLLQEISLPTNVKKLVYLDQPSSSFV